MTRDKLKTFQCDMTNSFVNERLESSSNT